MLRTALGPSIAAWLDDPAIIEVMLNPDDRVWLDRIGEGISDTGELLSAADGERIVRLVAHHVAVEVHTKSPRVSAELPEGGERFEGLLPPVTDRTDRVLSLVEGFVPEVRWLDDAETLTYLHSTISTRRQRVRVPETPMYLDALLADEPLIGGLEPKLGDHHLRTLTITGFPSVTFPGLLDELNRLAFKYCWSTRAIMLDKTDATKLLTRIRRQWFAKRKSVAAILKEVMTNEASTLLDSDASNR